eukprot:TRINITY_DN3386_c0_g2_i3.p1 TRINITY_DN3386_c0_g2~~TRINITY_DN3386_c0_g2_i3.p1  ORF type:complete len:551 (+),score=81.71 TRINITY_DN3386_c0_g2_i3:64-1716(+)
MVASAERVGGSPFALAGFAQHIEDVWKGNLIGARIASFTRNETDEWCVIHDVDWLMGCGQSTKTGGKRSREGVRGFGTRVSFTGLIQVALLWAVDAGGGRLLRQHRAPDAIVAHVNDVADMNMPECSCNCCQVIERTPSEQIVLPGGAVLSHTCGLPYRAEDDDTSSLCPTMCHVPEDATFSSSTMDQTKFCDTSCLPVVAAVGTLCKFVPHNAMNQAALLPASLAGGIPGWASAAAAAVAARALAERQMAGTVPGDSQREIDREREEEAHTANQASRNDEVVEQTAIAASDLQHTDVDLRTLIAGRIRAQAGAAMAHAATSGQEVRSFAHSANRGADLLGRFPGSLADEQGNLAGNSAAAKASASSAKEAAVESAGMAKVAEAEVSNLFITTRELTSRAIRLRAAKAAETAGWAYARRMAWDKPKAYRRIVAYRSGEPYAKVAAVAQLRASQYDYRAQELEREAQAARAQAKALTPQAHATDMMGDMLGAAVQQEKIHLAMDNARHLDYEAKQDRNIAADARRIEAMWRAASGQMVSRAAQFFSRNRAG